MNEIKLFSNKELGLSARAILNEDGSISINAEDTARGFGWTTVAKSGNVVVRWARMNSYCKEFGFSQQVGKDDYIPESLFYRLGMRAGNKTADKFQNWLAIDVIPSIRKTGGYVNNDELFLNTYLPYADESTRLIFAQTLKTVREQNETIKRQKAEIMHKEDVIIGLVEDIDLATKRQRITQIVRYGASGNYQERYSLLYSEFEKKYHCNLKMRMSNCEARPKIKNKMDYIDREMGMIPQLYEIACKLFENDVEKLKIEWESIVA